MPTFSVLDLETTGLNPEKDRIVEICLVRYNQAGVEEDSFVSLLNPGAPIPGEASAINGISDRMVANSPAFAEISSDLLRRLEEVVLVGHNVAAFDAKFLVAEFARVGVAWRPATVLDTLKLARTAYPGLKSHKLRELCKLAGITNLHAHRAESDARAAWELLCTIAADDVDDLTDLDKYELPATKAAVPPGLVARKPQKTQPDPRLQQTCAGEHVVFTGGFPAGASSREDAKNSVLARGGSVSNTITKKTTILFVGDNAGSKLDIARQRGVTIVPHSEFPNFITHGRNGISQTKASTVIRRHDGTTDVAGPETATTQQRPHAPAPVDPAPSAPAAKTVRDTTTGPVAAAGAATLPPPRSIPSEPIATRIPPSHYSPERTSPALVLALLLGAFGAHRFYLGHKRRGWIMLLASVLTCGFLTPLMLLLGWVDAYMIWSGRLRRDT